MKIYRVETIQDGYNAFIRQSNKFVVVQCYSTQETTPVTYVDVIQALSVEPELLNKPFPVGPFLEDLQKSYKDTCEAWLAPRRHKGFTWNDLPVPADQEAQTNFSSVLNLIQLGAPGPFLLHDNNNVDHMLTIAEVQQMSMQMAGFVQNCYEVCWAAKASIDAATTIEQCEEALRTMKGF